MQAATAKKKVSGEMFIFILFLSFVFLFKSNDCQVLSTGTRGRVVLLGTLWKVEG